MLIIKRKVPQSFLIGPDIKVTVLSTRGRHMRIGIGAPKDTVILRKEIAPRKSESTPGVGDG